MAAPGSFQLRMDDGSIIAVTILEAPDTTFGTMPAPDFGAHVPPALPEKYIQPNVLGVLGTSTDPSSAPAWWDAGDQRPVQAAIFGAAYAGHREWQADQVQESDSVDVVVQNGMWQLENTRDENGKGADRIVTWLRVPLLDVVSEDTIEAAEALGALDKQYCDPDAGWHHKLLWAGQHHVMDARAMGIQSLDQTCAGWMHMVRQMLRPYVRSVLEILCVYDSSTSSVIAPAPILLLHDHVVADIIFCPGAIVQYHNSDGAWMESFRITVELWAESTERPCRSLLSEAARAALSELHGWEGGDTLRISVYFSLRNEADPGFASTGRMSDAISLHADSALLNTKSRSMLAMPHSLEQLQLCELFAEVKSKWDARVQARMEQGHDESSSLVIVQSPATTQIRENDAGISTARANAEKKAVRYKVQLFVASLLHARPMASYMEIIRAIVAARETFE